MGAESSEVEQGGEASGDAIEDGRIFFRIALYTCLWLILGKAQVDYHTLDIYSIF